MICDRVLGHLDDEPFSAARRTHECDLLDLTWQECAQRFLRKPSRAGRPIGLLIPVRVRLRQGDVLHFDAQLLLSIHTLPCRACVIRAAPGQSLATIAYELGNLHWPAQILSTAVITPATDPVEAFLLRCGFSYTIEDRQFDPHAPAGTPLPRVADDFRYS